MFFLAAITLFAHPASEARDVIGVGAQPCAIALSAGRKIEADTWTLGYWSGVNAAGAHNVAIDGGAQAMLGRVKAYCASHTGVALQDAVATVLSGKD